MCSNAPLPTYTDKLVFILIYLRQNPIQAVQGQIFHMTQSNVSKWVHRTQEMLQTALALDHALPYRSVEAFRTYLQQTYAACDDTPLFITMAQSDQ